MAEDEAEEVTEARECHCCCEGGEGGSKDPWVLLRLASASSRYRSKRHGSAHHTIKVLILLPDSSDRCSCCTLGGNLSCPIYSQVELGFVE